MDRLTRRGTHNGLNGFWVKEINGTESFISWKNDCYEGIAKLAHYEDLEEQGRLVELACATDETVWVGKANSPQPVREVIYGYKSDILNDMERGYVFGKTKEEAEAKLAEKGGAE